jgi:nitrite reductase (NO-forming)
VLDHWALLRPAHAWLNVIGFVGLTIVTTLVHLWPTVLGSRIGAGRAGTAMGFAWAAGPPLVAAGFATGSDGLARVGAAVTLAGAGSLVAFAALRWRARGRWTIDLPWHRAAIGHLAAGVAWGAGGAAAASALVLARGASADAWSSSVLVALGVGWVAQTLVGAWTHLLPTIGPGDPVRHEAQRGILGRGGPTRLTLWQVGTASLVVGVVAGLVLPAVAGGVVVGAVVVTSAALLATAARAR